MSQRLNIDLLRTFHAVARYQRFKDAAHSVHRSASTVTTQIHKLEALVGRPLFYRNNQGTVLTLYGKKLLEQTNDFLLSHDRLLASITEQTMQGKIRLGLPDAYASGFMRDFMPLLIATHPLLELEIEARSSATISDMFSRRQLDLAIVVTATPLERGELLCQTQPVWATAAHYKPKQGPLTLAVQLEGCPYRDSMIRALKSCGLDYRILLESMSWPAVEACVLNGFAMGVVEKSRLGAGFIQPEQELPPLPPHYLYLLTDSESPLALHLHERLMAEFRI